MTIEEKARAYDEALQRARALNNGEAIYVEAGTTTCEYIFPELKESEPESIREDLIEWFKEFSDMIWRGHYKKDVLAWLEKQGEHAELNQLEVTKTYGQELEPKFHPGDWIIDNEYGEVLKVTKADANSYEITTQDGEALGDILKEDVECNHRIWTIQDANDGDVLYLQHEGVEHVIMYKRLVKKNFHTILSVHCAYDGSTNDFFEDCDSYHCITSERDEKEIRPATKEERGLLFQKMADAGYKWNSEKKRIEKIEHESVDNVEPKFNPGDYIVPDNINSPKIWKVINIDDDGYYNIQCITNPEYDGIYRVPAFFLENDYRLWTIEDAKDGDVLVDEDNNIGLYRKEKDDLYWHSYIYVGCDNCLRGFGGYHNYENTKPADKEQRDTLEMVMTNAGYRWDKEKLKLEKL